MTVDHLIRFKVANAQQAVERFASCRLEDSSAAEPSVVEQELVQSTARDPPHRPRQLDFRAASVGGEEDAAAKLVGLDRKSQLEPPEHVDSDGAEAFAADF